MRTSRLAILFALMLLAAGALRIGWMTAHHPVLGYANQYDMGRTSACFGLWPDLPAPARYEAHLEAPIARYVAGEHRPDECYVSSELLFAGVAMASWKVAAENGLADPTAMDIRWVGGIKAVALCFLALLFTWRLRDQPAWMLTHAATFALVLADPVVTLWLNTLYTEFAAVLFTYAAVVCLAVIAGNAPDRAGWYLGFALALLGLGLSRQQHVLLPACLLLLAWPAIWRNQRRFVAPAFLAACAALALQAAVIERPPSIGAANNVNVVLGTLLPASADQDRSLARLGLPGECRAVIGATWYVGMGEDVGARCPGVLTLSRARVAGLLLFEPGTALRALARAVPLSQAALLGYVGVVEGRAFAAVGDLPPLPGFSIAAVVERLPPAFYLGLFLAALAASAVSLAAWMITTVRRGSPSLEATLGSALGGVFLYAMLTSVFGDGLVEFPRHAHLGSVALYALALLGVALLASRLGARLSGPRRPYPAAGAGGTSGYGWALLAALVVVPAASPLWLAAWRAQPIAIGVVDDPVSNQSARSTITLHGWVMDPFGPATAITIVNATTRLEGRAWGHPTDPAGVALARTFPTYRDPGSARFETIIDAKRFGGVPLNVKTYALNKEGIMTEIDRRVFAAPLR